MDGQQTHEIRFTITMAWKIQIKMSMRYLTPLRMEHIKNTRITHVGADVAKKRNYIPLYGHSV